MRFLLICSLILVIFTWSKTYKISSELNVIDQLPSELTLKLYSLGDYDFIHKIYSLQIQNAGDSFGRYTPLQKYDYHLLYKWLELLDSLDKRSNILPAVVSYYYSQTQHPEDTIHLVSYLYEHSKDNIRQKWWWIYQGTHIANYRLKNPRLALQLANLLASSDYNLPIWTKQLPAFINEQLGEFELARDIILNLLNDENSYTKEEMNFMTHFIKERLDKR